MAQYLVPTAYCGFFIDTQAASPYTFLTKKQVLLSIHMKHLRLIIIFLITLCFGPILFIAGLKFFHRTASYLFGFMGPNWSVHMVNVTGAFLFCLVFCVCFGLIGVFISKCGAPRAHARGTSLFISDTRRSFIYQYSRSY